MSIHLLGGGELGAAGAEVVAPFIAESSVRAALVGRSVPRVALLRAVAGVGNSSVAGALRSAGPIELLTEVVGAGARFDTGILSDIDGLVVDGGPTPEVRAAVLPIVDHVRLLVADGLPYLGYSAGAVLAADRALVGGWRIGGVEVCPVGSAEGLDEVEFADGFGLVDLTIDVHAVQRGTLPRLVATVEAGLVEAGLAIDENTALIVGDGALTVRGTGSVWRVVAGDDEGSAVTLSTMGA